MVKLKLFGPLGMDVISPMFKETGTSWIASEAFNTPDNLCHGNFTYSRSDTFSYGQECSKSYFKSCSFKSLQEAMTRCTKSVNNWSFFLHKISFLFSFWWSLLTAGCHQRKFAGDSWLSPANFRWWQPAVNSHFLSFFDLAYTSPNMCHRNHSFIHYS